MYNGWLHTVLDTGTICFAADGCNVWSKHNGPGLWNDSDTSLEFRSKLLDPGLCPDTRMNVVSDSTFPCSVAMVGRILTPLKDGDLERIQPELRSAARTLHNAITSVRQAAEWGMGSVQKVFSRLNLPLPYDQELRGMRLNKLFRLANYRVRAVGISQICTAFAGEMETPATLL
uniref:DDE Tnp4 domain-containing protein n=1 Tax=Phytophthora ramorum TaxID=164328 RepID=H3GVX1_PHYRM